MAAIDSIAYFTNGLCVPRQHLDAVSYFTLGLVIPSSTTSGGGISDDRVIRTKFVQNRREEADLLTIILAWLTINDD